MKSYPMSSLTTSQELRLGSSMKAANQKIVDQDEIVAVSVNRSLLSVDYASASSARSEVPVLTRDLENIEISDYLQEGDVGFKKPKVSSVSSPTSVCSPHTLHL